MLLRSYGLWGISRSDGSIRASPYLANPNLEAAFLQIFIQRLLKEGDGVHTGQLRIFVLNFIADTMGRDIYQFADIERAPPGQLGDDRFRGNHPIKGIFPEPVQQGNRIGSNVRT